MQIWVEGGGAVGRFLVALADVGRLIPFRLGVATHVAEALPLLAARLFHGGLPAAGGRATGRVCPTALAEPAGVLAPGLVGNVVAVHDRVASGRLISHAGLEAASAVPGTRRAFVRAGMDELDEIARSEIGEGWNVLDADGDAVGVVDVVHDGSFTLRTSVGGSLEIGFGDVESADDGRVTLSLSGEELTSELDT